MLESVWFDFSIRVKINVMLTIISQLKNQYLANKTLMEVIIAVDGL